MSASAFQIAALAGDGIGPEVMREAISVLRAVENRFSIRLTIAEAPVGWVGIDSAGHALSPDVMNLCQKSDAILFGSVGLPDRDGTVPKEQRPERAALLRLRQEFELYANLRPVRLYSQLAHACPLKPERIAGGVDMLVVRELSLDGTGPGQFSEMFPPGSLEGYHALAELDQVTRLNLDHVMLPVEGAVILLKGMAGLEHAGLGVFADDKIVAAAADSPKLKTLAFGHWATVPESPLTKAGAQAFAKLRSLESLHAGEQAPPAGANLADDKWHHAAYVWHSEPRQQRLFIDGQLIATNAGPGGNTGLTGTITLGRSNSGGSFKDGSLDEFRVYSRRLAAEEISQLSKWRR
jgi:hypothetical protein